MFKNWSYNEGKALINAYKNRKDEYFKTRNKKYFWESILSDLEAMNILETPTTAKNVEVKWRSLYRAFKSAKDRGTGTSPSKFLYMKDMDDIFENNPAISSPHSLSVGVERCPTPTPTLVRRHSSESTSNASGSKENVRSKRKNVSMAILEMKKIITQIKKKCKRENLNYLKNISLKKKR